MSQLRADPSSFMLFPIADCQLLITDRKNRQLAIDNRQYLHSSPLRRPTSIVRNRSGIANRADAQPGICNCPDRRFTSASRTLHPHFTLLHSSFVSLFCSFVCCLLSSE